MTKFLLATLVLVLLGAAVYFTFPTKINSLFIGAKNNTSKEITINETTEPIKVATPTPQTTAEDDLTALDKDLAELDSSEKSLTDGVNGL